MPTGTGTLLDAAIYTLRRVIREIFNAKFGHPDERLVPGPNEPVGSGGRPTRPVTDYLATEPLPYGEHRMVIEWIRGRYP